MTALALSPARQRVMKLWRAYPRELVALGAIALAGAIAVGGVAWSTPNVDGIRAARTEGAVPAPPPMLVRDLAPGDALKLNEEIPITDGDNPAARPFSIGNVGAATRAQAIECLTSAVYYESGDQSDDGERAVAQVVLNRVRHPAFPSTVCGVVYQGSTRATGCQFTFTCDGSLERRPDAEGWARAKRIAEAALNGAVYAPVGWATHYHADYVVPYWASTMAKNAVVGAHLFYRWPGGWGQPSAFSQHYARVEPSASALKAAALAAVEARPAAQPGVEQAVTDIPGAQLEKAPPGRVAIRFNLASVVAARKAVEAAPHLAYVDQVKASENLRWSLSGSAPDADQKPLGVAQASTSSSPKALPN